MSVLDQLIKALLIKHGAALLEDDCAIPIKAQGLELVEDSIGDSRTGPMGIQVIDSNPPHPGMRSGIEVTRKRGEK